MLNSLKETLFPFQFKKAINMAKQYFHSSMTKSLLALRESYCCDSSLYNYEFSIVSKRAVFFLRVNEDQRRRKRILTGHLKLSRGSVSP